MIPILYDGDEITFTSNGLGRLPDCIACEVTEERNGIYECMFQYPVTGRLYDEIKPGRIIAVTHDNNHDIQPFDIYSVSAPLDGVVTFYARHISYRLSNIILTPFTASSCSDALSKMETRTYNVNPFTFWTDKDVDGVWKNETPASCKAVLVGQSGSILDVYGKGEYEFDKFTVRLYVNRGTDTGISIRYGVNLKDLTQEIDNSDMYSAVAPFWKSTDGDKIITLPEGIIMADNMPTQLYPWTTNTGEYVRDNNGEIIYFNVPEVKPIPLDLSGDFQEEPTVEQLRSLARSRLNNSEAWLPTENITISFVDQSSTFDYKDIAKLQPVTLCDKVNVYCGPLNVSAAKIQAVKIVYDVLSERNKTIELGKIRKTYIETMMEQIASAYVSKSDANNIVSSAVDNATKLITGATDSHIRFVYDANGGLQEIVIMDTEDIETAQKIWRWNTGGLGFSGTGYAGPYTLAITQDGAIVADAVKTGILSDAEGNNYWNLLTGFLNTQSGQIGSFTLDNGALTYNGGNSYASIDYDGINFLTHYGNIDYNCRLYAQGVEVCVPEIGNKWSLYSARDSLDGTITFCGLGYLDTDARVYRQYIVLAPSNADTLIPDEHTVFTRQTLTKYHHYTCATIYILPNGADNSDNNGYIKKYTNDLIIGHNGAGYISLVGSTSVARTIDFLQNAYCDKNLVVNGTKSRLVDTKSYGERLLYCYETPTPMFGDIGEGVISESGDCYVWFDAVFAKTIDTKGYQVFLQPYGRGECYVKERSGAYFVVCGTPGLAFGWEVKAKQVDFEQLRLEKTDVRIEPETKDYTKMAEDHINQIKESRGIGNEHD